MPAVSSIILSNYINLKAMIFHAFPNAHNCICIDLTYVEPRASCNSFIDNQGDTRGIYDIDSQVYIPYNAANGFTCKQTQVCVQSDLNRPGWNHISYNNFLSTMMNVFTVISTEDWTNLMYMSEDGISHTAASIFYCFCIYLMTFIMVPMFIGNIYFLHIQRK